MLAWQHICEKLSQWDCKFSETASLWESVVMFIRATQVAVHCVVVKGVLLDVVIALGIFCSNTKAWLFFPLAELWLNSWNSVWLYMVSVCKSPVGWWEKKPSLTTSCHPNKSMCNVLKHYHETHCHGNTTSHKTPSKTVQI